MMKKFRILFMALLWILVVAVSILPVVAASVEDQVPSDEANATPLKNANGEEIAFEVGEAGSGNSTAGIVAMVAVFGICLFLCGEGIYSYIKKSRKRRSEMFETINRE